MAGKMRNCSECGKVFVALNNSKICIDCREKEEEVVREIISFVRDHPKTTVPVIVKELGVHDSLVRRLIREGRLFSASHDLGYPCDKCGEPIQNGKYCDKCTKEMTDSLQAQSAKLASSGASGAVAATANRRGYKTLQDR